MKTTLFMAALAAGITLAATADAREGQGPRMNMPSFEELDANADGSVTSEEIATAMQARGAARFAETDSNGDGALSAEEMIAAADQNRQDRMADRVARQIEKADTNGDGLLQADELAAQMDDRRGQSPDRLFNRFDVDEDGSLSAEEFADAQERMDRRGDRGARHGNRGDN